MFEDSLVESGGKLKTKRGATTVISFILEILFLCVLVLLPLIFTEALPTKQLMTMLTAPPPPPPPPPPPAAAPVIVKKIQSELDNGQLRTPTAIPKKIQMIKEDEPPPSTGTGRRSRRCSRWGSRWRHGRRTGQRYEQRSNRRA